MIAQEAIVVVVVRYQLLPNEERTKNSFIPLKTRGGQRLDPEDY